MRKTFLFILALCATTLAWGATTVTKTAKEISAGNGGWTKGTVYHSAVLDDVITVTTPSETTGGVYYNTDYTDTHDWRMYQARTNGQFTIKAAEGYKITSVTLTYAVTNTGVVSTSMKESGVATPAANQIKSGTAYTFANSEITFYVGNTTAATTNGQARIRRFSVTYEKGIVEDFKNPDGTDWNFATDATSVDSKYFSWTMARARHNGTAMDALKSGIAGVAFNGTPASGNAQFSTTVEGGVKFVSFKWNQCDANENKTETIKLTVGDKSNEDSFSAVGGSEARPADRTLSFAPEVKTNAAFKIERTAGNRCTFGPITIVPYLRYTYTETQEVKIGVGSFDCSLQIDNTDNEGTITYSSDNTDVVSFASESSPIATLNGGGEATITATWSEGASTSFKLKVIAKSTPEISFENEEVTITDLYTTEPVENKLTVTEGAGEVTYTSSNPLVAKIVENQVMVVGVGAATITATAAENEDYVSASASYALTVNEPEGETAVKENFKGKLAKQDSYTNTEASFTDQLGLYSWKANGYRYNETWVRLKTTEDPYLKFDGNQEGGIKRLVFTWFRAGKDTELLPIHTSIKVMDGDNELADASINLEGSADHINQLPYNCRIEVKQSAQLVIDNKSADGAVMHFQDIKIVPYLLFTTKSDEAFLSLVDEYDIKNVLIDNTDDGEVVYSILTADAQSQINDDGVVSFDEVTKSETITIQAAWTPAGESSATVITTMTLYVDAEYGTDKTVEEKFSNYGETGWTSSEASEVTKTGDVYDWRTKLTRHKTSDKLVDGQQAIWFAQGGYVATADATDNTKVGPAEGGIKRIAFDWNQNAGDQTGDDLYISISVDDDEVSAIRRDGGAQPTEKPWQYIHNLNVKKNATLKIENKSTTSEKEGGRVKIGTIVITPYLLYTVKDTAIDMTKVATFTNDKLIDNCDDEVAIVYSIVGENDGVASINTQTGEVTASKAGTVTVQAAWGDVTTTYMLTIKTKGDVDAHFTTEGKLEKVLTDGSFTNAVVVTDGEATPAYESDNTNVAEVDEDEEGKVTIKAIGTATITATMAETDNFLAWEDSYTVIVRTGVADDDKLVESFSGITKDASTSETEWKGDLKDYFSWKVKSTRHNGTAGDTIGGAGVAGTVLFAKGQIATDGVIEGGIKYFTFNWKQPYVEQGATLRLTLNAGDKAYQQDYVVATDNGSTTHEHLYFAGNMQVKKNVQLTLKNESFKTESDDPLTSNGRIAIDKFEIVPYLFYKTKYHKMDVANSGSDTWINDDLINNTDGGAIEYSIEDIEGKDVAEIDVNGQVTAKSNGKAKVTATWTPTGALEGEVVTTTYEVEVFYSKLDAELAFDPEEITVGEDAIAFTTPTLSNPHELTIKYSSSDETIATVNENSGVVTLKQVVGDVVISAKSEETDTYQEGNASYTIHVLPLPTVTFPNLTGNTKTVDMDQVPFTESISVKVGEVDYTSSAEITYTSDNEEVAVIKDGEVNIIGVGTATITAKIALKAGSYAGRDVYYTLTVEDKPLAGKQWTETFSSIGNVNDYITSRKPDIVGDSSIYSWAMRNYRRRQTQADSLATEQAIRLSNAKNNYIETLNNQEGGIKRISFNWRTPGTETGQLPINLNVSVCYNNYQDTVKRPMTRAKSKDNMTDNLYCSNFFVKQNAKLKIDIADETYSVMLIGPITIVPYLLYTTKTVEKTYVEGGDNTIDVTENLINNLEDGETVTYTLSDGAQAQIDGSIITLANATEDVTVTAKWGEVSTTFTLKVTKAKDPDPEPNFTLEDKAAGALATICLPKKIAKVENATLYSISYGNTQMIEFVEADLENDAAGMPYLVQVAADGNANFYYGEGGAVTEPVSAVDAKGFVGKLAADDPNSPTYVPKDGSAIIITGGQLHIAGEWCVLTQNHAYISTTYLPETATPSSAPRRTIRLYNPDAAPTNLNGLNGAVKPMKVLRDGQLYIIRDTKTYNAQGIEVQ